MTEDISLKIKKRFDFLYAGKPIKANSPDRIMTHLVRWVREELDKIYILGEPILNVTFTPIMQNVEKNVFYISIIGDLETRMRVSAPILYVKLYRTKSEWKTCSCRGFTENIIGDILNVSERMKKYMRFNP